MLELVRGLLINLFVLLGFAAACTLVSSWATRQQREIVAWLVGLLYGSLSVIVMLVPVVTHSGMVVDCRVGVIGTAALLGGPRTAILSLLFPCAYRIFLGGADVLPGLMEIVLACALGTLCNLWYRRRPHTLTLGQALLFSLIVGFGTNLAMSSFFMFETVMNGAAEIGIAGVIVVFFSAPVSMALLSTLVVLEQHHFEAMEMLAETERRMLHSQKMAAIGQLSHKIAHSILNSLTIIMGDAELSKGEAGVPNKVMQYMDDIIKTVHDLSQMTGELVAFANPGKLRLRRMDLSTCLVGIDRMLAQVVGSGIEVVVAKGHEVGQVEMDPNRIEQVIVHLAINASEAMSESGKLVIATAAAELSKKDRARLQAGVHEKDRHKGAFAVLSVQDTGCGMTAEVAGRIFEPFFTTKEKRDNAGLGLSTVYNIVQSHHGFIDVKTQPGAGTTVFVFFPVVT